MSYPSKKNVLGWWLGAVVLVVVDAFVPVLKAEGSLILVLVS
jgi:hypothetical protein